MTRPWRTIGVVAWLAAGLLAQRSDQPPESTVRRTTSDVARTAGFYERLGFDRGLAPDGTTTRLRRGDTVLDLVPGKSDPDALNDAVQVLVPSLAETRQAALARGIKLIDAGLEAAPAESLSINDPDGSPILFRTRADAARPALPRDGAFNPAVQDRLARYPTDGHHQYFWPKGGEWRGCTKDLTYAGQKLCAGDPEGRAYCCGLTFEVFLDAWQLWCRRAARPYRIQDWDLARVRQLQTEWFGSAEDRTCVRTAIVKNKLGRQITKLEDARAGDFVQLWRQSGTGHSVIFLEWKKKGDDIAGFTYWSTQKSTQGIGRRTEWFGTEKSDVKRDEFYLCRVGAP